MVPNDSNASISEGGWLLLHSGFPKVVIVYGLDLHSAVSSANLFCARVIHIPLHLTITATFIQY